MHLQKSRAQAKNRLALRCFIHTFSTVEMSQVFESTTNKTVGKEIVICI